DSRGAQPRGVAGDLRGTLPLTGELGARLGLGGAHAAQLVALGLAHGAELLAQPTRLGLEPLRALLGLAGARLERLYPLARLAGLGARGAQLLVVTGAD